MSGKFRFPESVKRRAIELYLEGASLQQAAERSAEGRRVPTGESVRLWLLLEGHQTRGNGRPRLIDERKKALELAASRTMSNNEIAEAVGVSRTAVGIWLRDAGMALTRSEGARIVASRHIPEMRSQFRQLVAEGRTSREITRITGRSQMTVWRHLRAMGLHAADGRKREYRKAA